MSENKKYKLDDIGRKYMSAGYKDISDEEFSPAERRTLRFGNVTSRFVGMMLFVTFIVILGFMMIGAYTYSTRDNITNNMYCKVEFGSDYKYSSGSDYSFIDMCYSDKNPNVYFIKKFGYDNFERVNITNYR